MSTIPDSPVAAWPFRLAEETAAEYRARTTQTSEASKTKKKSAAKKPLPGRLQNVEEFQPTPGAGVSFQISVSLPWADYQDQEEVIREDGSTAVEFEANYITIDINYGNVRMTVWNHKPVLAKASADYPCGEWVDGNVDNHYGSYLDSFEIDTCLSEEDARMFIPQVFTRPPDLAERLAAQALHKAEMALEEAKREAEKKKEAADKAIKDKLAKDLARINKSVEDAQRAADAARNKLIALTPKQN